MIDRDARRRELLGEQGERGRASDPVLRDRPAGAPVELVGVRGRSSGAGSSCRRCRAKSRIALGELLRLRRCTVHGPESTRGEPGSGGLRSVGTRLAVLPGPPVLLLGLAGRAPMKARLVRPPLTVEQALSSSPTGRSRSPASPLLPRAGRSAPAAPCSSRIRRSAASPRSSSRASTSTPSGTEPAAIPLAQVAPSDATVPSSASWPDGVLR